MDIFSDIGDKYDVEIVESNWDVDHIHVLFDASPSTNLVKFINAYKSASSRSIILKLKDFYGRVLFGKQVIS